jgi:hypothetical protein
MLMVLLVVGILLKFIGSEAEEFMFLFARPL